METIFVVDSAPFINHQVDIFDKNIITVQEVLNEIKDKKAREYIANHNIKTQIPSEEAIKRIIDFSKKTGDYASLSLTDIKVLALTLQLHLEFNGEKQQESAIKKKPRKRRPKKKQVQEVKESEENQTTNISISVGDPLGSNITGSFSNFSIQDKENQCNFETKVQPKEEIDPTLLNGDISGDDNNASSQFEAFNDLNSDFDSSSEGEWITPSNLYHFKSMDGHLAIEGEDLPNVVCMTSDYAMQVIFILNENVLLQMKLGLVSEAGQRIKKIKTWILRCHACFETTSKLDKVFCPRCGNNTLIRTSVGVDDAGKMNIYLKKNFQFKNRGTVYPIPHPKGGRSTNLILREDQKEYTRALNTKKRLDKKIMNQEMGVAELFGDSRLSSTGDPIIGFGRKNPNEVRGRRRK
jgi:RNA-binding protein NOB1